MTETTTDGRRQQYRADKALIMAKYTPLLKAMSHTDPGYQSLWEERARKVRELTEAYEVDQLKLENQILREQLNSVRVLAEALKKAADLGAVREPESDAWLGMSRMATQLCCAL